MALTLPNLRLGSSGAEVGNWQRFLASRGFRDGTGRPLSADESFGPRTVHASRSWQAVHKLVPDAIIGPTSRRVAANQGFIQFLQAKHYKPVPSSRVIDLLVIHDMEYWEVPEGAEWCAQFFAGPNAPIASAHYSVDVNSIVQSVRDGEVAYHAPGANHNGIGIEHAGFAKQSRAEWLDDYSRAELALSAQLAARLCRLYSIPITYVSAANLHTGARGFTGHHDVSLAFGKSTHWDPGPAYPWDEYLRLVQIAFDALT